jgi:hypothetical protein
MLHEAQTAMSLVGFELRSSVYERKKTIMTRKHRLSMRHVGIVVSIKGTKYLQ